MALVDTVRVWIPLINRLVDEVESCQVESCRIWKRRVRETDVKQKRIVSIKEDNTRSYY